VRAALLHGPGDLRVEDIPEPAGEVLVDVRAATACGTDVKSLQRGHRILDPFPCRFGHETAGVRRDTGERVLVGDSVACGRCAPCAAGRAQLCRDMRWVVGGFAEAIAAPVAALHVLPDALDFAGAAVAEPLAACVHAVARGNDARDCAVLGGGTVGLMLARLLVLEGRDVTLADRHRERRAQAQAFGVRAVEMLWHEHFGFVFEVAGTVAAWEDAFGAAAPGGCVVYVGGCPRDSRVTLPTAPIHYDEVDVRGAFHHDRAEVERALALLADGSVDWRALVDAPIGLEDLAGALRPDRGGPALKPLVEPWR